MFFYVPQCIFTYKLIRVQVEPSHVILVSSLVLKMVLRPIFKGLGLVLISGKNGKVLISSHGRNPLCQNLLQSV